MVVYRQMCLINLKRKKKKRGHTENHCYPAPKPYFTDNRYCGCGSKIAMM